MRQQRLLIAFIVLALIVIGIGAYFYSRGAASPPPTPGTKTGQALIGGPFALVDQQGKRVTDQDFRGRYMLVYFGYTHCPDQCPLDLDTMSQALDRMPADLAARVQPIFITVDPKRDTQAVLRDYAGHFHPRLEALTGNDDEVAAAVKAYRVYVHLGEPQGNGGDYPVDHSAFTFLMGPDGGYVAHFSPGTTPDDMAKRLATLVHDNAATS
jgi:cytochrome oxidase Cu insertion factor (SCO1/SenC/PrrC family)